MSVGIGTFFYEKEEIVPQPFWSSTLRVSLSLLKTRKASKSLAIYLARP